MRRAVVTGAIAVLLAMPLPASARSGDIARIVSAAPPRAAAIYDVQEQRFLGGYRDTRALPVASLLKMVTALVVSDRLDPANELVISARAARAEADRVIWKQGARFTVDEVMHGMLLESSNGAAYALAERTSGSIRRFRTDAAALLAQIGATDTHLVDPSGLDARGQRSTARDLALIANAVLADPWLAGIVRLQRFDLPWTNGRRATFRNANPYHLRDPSAIGVKNGFTSQAGNTVAAASERGGRVHIVVVLGGPDPFDQARWLMDHAFELAPGRPEPVPQQPALPEQAPERVNQVEPATASTQPAEQPARSPTLARFMVASAFAGYTIGLVRANRRRARRMQRLAAIKRRAATLRAWPDQRSPSSQPRPSSSRPRAQAAQPSATPAAPTASSGRSRASRTSSNAS